MNRKISRSTFLAGVGAAAATAAVAGPEMFLVEASGGPIRIGARNFTEEQIAGWLYSEILSHHGIKVQTNVGFGTENEIFTALKSSSLDVVPDYLGNGLVDLNQVYRPGTSPYQVWVHVNKEFKKKHFGVVLLNPAYKFNDQNVFVTTHKFSKKHHVKTLSDLAHQAPHIRFEVLLECTQRTDCLIGFNKIYHPKKFKEFASPSSGTTPNNGPFYGDLISGKFDVVQGYGVTDSAIFHYHFLPLKDDKHMFPPDQMTPFVRPSVAHGKVKRYLNALAPYLTNANFRKMNAEVDFGGKQPQAVARAFLKHHHLI